MRCAGDVDLRWERDRGGCGAAVTDQGRTAGIGEYRAGGDPVQRDFDDRYNAPCASALVLAPSLAREQAITCSSGAPCLGECAIHANPYPVSCSTSRTVFPYDLQPSRAVTRLSRRLAARGAVRSGQDSFALQFRLQRSSDALPIAVIEHCVRRAAERVPADREHK